MPNELTAGHKFLQYEVISTLGSGGMSRVYLCEDLVLHRRVAVKQLLSQDNESRSVMRLQQEGQSLAALSHPNIVKILTCFSSDEGTPFLVMELLHGCSLDELLAKNGSLTLGEVMQLASQLCGALQHAHDQGIVHRDIKPSNIFLCNRRIDNVKLIDFGIAKNVDSSINATRTGEFVGSPTYISPEQALQKPVTNHSDQYSLGCVLYECLSGHPPFSDQSAVGLILKHVNEEPPSLVKNAFIPRAVAKAIARSLKKDPDERFDSMSDFLAAMEGKNVEPTSNKSLPLMLAAVAGVVVISLAVLALNLQSSKPVAPIETMALSAHTHQYSGGVIPLEPISDDPFSIKIDRAGALDDAYVIQTIFRDPNITALDLNKRVISLSLLNALTKAKHLRELFLARTQINDVAGDYLAKIPTLRKLDVSKTSLTDNFVAKISSLPNLEYVSLSETETTSNCGKALAGLKSLKQVFMRSTGINDSFGDYVRDMPKMELIDLTGCDLSDEFVKKISTLQNLRSLVFDSTKISAASFPYLSKLGSLRTLYLDSINGPISDIEPIMHLPLTTLSLKGDDLPPKVIHQLAQMKTLDSLRLDRNAISDDDLRLLATLPKLHNLSVIGCELLTPSGIEAFKKRKPKCTIIVRNAEQNLRYSKSAAIFAPYASDLGGSTSTDAERK